MVKWHARLHSAVKRHITRFAAPLCACRQPVVQCDEVTPCAHRHHLAFAISHQKGIPTVPTSLTQKLRILEGSRVALLNAPDGYARTLDPLPGGAEVTTISADAGERYDVTLLFARDHAELERLAPIAIAATRDGGALWIAWPKGGVKAKGAITRDTLWPVLAQLGWGPVSNVALDETWSALRLRPEAEVKRASTAFGQG
jgi:hypothetical protein